MAFAVICDNCGKNLGTARTETQAEAMLSRHRKTKGHRRSYADAFGFGDIFKF